MASRKFTGFTLSQLEEEEKHDKTIPEVNLYQLTQLEEKLISKYTRSMCPPESKINLSQLNPSKLETQVVNKFTEPTVIKAAMCITEHIFSETQLR